MCTLWQGGRASRDLGFPHGFSVHWCLAHVGILFFPQVGLKVLFQKCLGDKKLFGVVLANFHVLLTECACLVWLSFRIIIVLGLSSFFAVGVDDCLGLFGVAPCRKTSLQMALLRADPWGSASP